MRMLSLLAAVLLAGLSARAPVYAQDFTAVEFEPKVGAIGSRVTLKGAPKGAQVKFGGKSVPLLVEPNGKISFVVPDGAASSFIEVHSGGKIVGRSAVPFVVSGASIVNTPKLIGLREAIDVFGYSEPAPAGATKAEITRPVLRLDDAGILTVGEMAPQGMPQAVVIGDLASAGKGPLCCTGFLITARPPVKKPKVTPPETAPPD